MVGVLMTNFDIEYLKLCKKILKEGIEVENRTGVNTIKISSYNFEFDLSKEFPILTTKQTFYRQAIIELLWIWQVGSNDVRWLQDRNVHIWDEWEIAEDGKWRANQNVLENGKLVKKDIEYKEFVRNYPVEKVRAELGDTFDSREIEQIKEIAKGKKELELSEYFVERAIREVLWNRRSYSSVLLDGYSDLIWRTMFDETVEKKMSKEE